MTAVPTNCTVHTYIQCDCDLCNHAEAFVAALLPRQASYSICKAGMNEATMDSGAHLVRINAMNRENMITSVIRPQCQRGNLRRMPNCGIRCLLRTTKVFV